MACSGISFLTTMGGKGNVMGYSPYRIFDHTADLGLEIYGKDLRELLENAVFALTACIVYPETIELREYRPLSVEGEDSEELLVNVLREILYLASGTGFLTQCFCIDRLEEGCVTGRAGGESFDASRHCLRGELKAVTYHGACITDDEGRLRARVILDV